MIFSKRRKILRFKKKKILNHFILDGVGSSICDGFTDSQFFSFASSLAPSISWFGLVTSIQNLLTFFLQLWSSRLLHFFKSHKKYVIFCVSAQIVFLFALIWSVYLKWGFFTFIILSVGFTVLGSLSVPVWSHWVSELLPDKKRGVCFGVRNQVSAPAQLLAVLLAGGLLQWGQKHVKLGFEIEHLFGVIFLMGLAAKLFSFWQLLQQPDVKNTEETALLAPENPLKFLKMSWRCHYTQRVALILSVSGFAIHLSLPFQTTYLLHVLHLGYDELGLITATYLGVRFLISQPIGRLLDHSGARVPLLVSSALLPLSPLGWVSSHSFFGIFLTQMIASAVWSVFDLSVFAFISESTTQERRQRAFTVRYMAWNLSSVGGAVLGGLLVSQMKNPGFVFYASFLARSVAALIVMEALSSFSFFGMFRSPKRENPILQEAPVKDSSYYFVKKFWILFFFFFGLILQARSSSSDNLMKY